MPDTGVTAVAHVIQLAVAPVFLLTGIGAMLNVMTSRLSRIVDRARFLQGDAGQQKSSGETVVEELSALSRRSHLISHAITLCTITALLVSAVIAVLFIGAFVQVDTSTLVAVLFITAMIAFIAGLLQFLREIFIATASVKIGLQRLPVGRHGAVRKAAAPPNAEEGDLYDPD